MRHRSSHIWTKQRSNSHVDSTRIEIMHTTSTTIGVRGSAATTEQRHDEENTFICALTSKYLELKEIFENNDNDEDYVTDESNIALRGINLI